MALMASGERASADTSAIDFELPLYASGNIDGQDGWSKTGAYDSEVVVNAPGAPVAFGDQSFRISNAVTSGSFGDQAFSKSLTDEAGETSAASDGMSGGTRQTFFSAEWDFASTVPGAEQPGLSVVASPDRGDGARMSWVQMTDTPTGIDINFNDYQAGTGFVQTNVATGLDRSAIHNIKLTMTFVDGVANDVVGVYVDGVLMHTGTSWEDYFRVQEGNPTRPVDSILFRTGGAPAPATAGNGFVIDNLTLFSGAVTQCTTVRYVDANTGSDANGGTSPSDAKKTIQAAVNQVDAGGTVNVAAGTYAEQVLVTENLTLTGAGEGASNIVPPADMDATPPSYGGDYIAQAQVSLGNAATLTMSGFTLDGPFPAEYGCGTDAFGIYVHGEAILNLSATTISDTYLTPKPGLFGCQVGIGVWVGGLDGLSAGHATVTDVNITGYQKGGIVASGAGTSLEVSGSVIAGEGSTTLIAQNGIQVSDGATARIVSNIISGNFYTPTDYVACGIILYDAGGVKQSKNTSVGNEKYLCNFGKGGGQFNPTH